MTRELGLVRVSVNATKVERNKKDGLWLNPKDCIMDDKQPSCLPVILASKRFNEHPVAWSS